MGTTRRLTEADVRRIAKEEVEVQLAPIVKEQEKTRQWRLGLWSNGSGGPPGYLETARAEDKEHFTEIFKTLKELKDANSAHELVAAVVADRHQRRQKWFDFAKAHGWKIATVILGSMLTVAGWAYREISPVVHIIWEEYMREHPAAQREIKDVSGAQGMTKADPRTPQDATAGPTHY